MTRTRGAGRAGAFLIPIALVLAACGGATASGGATAGTSGAPVPPTTAPVDSAAPSTGLVLPSGLAIPSFDLSQLTAGLANVDSYRVDIKIGDSQTYTGTVVTKPVLSRDLLIDGKTHVVVIGNDAWVGENGQPLAPVPAAIASGLFAVMDPTVLVGAFSGPQWAASAANQGAETKNGVNATHYRIDGSTLAAGFSGLPSGATIDTWISDTGLLVGLEASGFPNGGLSIQVTGIDDPANKVDRPS